MKSTIIPILLLLGLHNFAFADCNYQVKFDSAIQGLQVSFSSQTPLNNAKFFWDFGDGQNAATVSPLHTFAKAGSYEISLTISNADGCQITEKSKIFVFDTKSVATITAIQNSPEPFATTTTVSFELAKSGTVIANLFDMSGKSLGTVAKGEMVVGKNTIVVNRNNLVAGMYVLELVTNDQTSSHKITIQ